MLRLGRWILSRWCGRTPSVWLQRAKKADVSPGVSPDVNAFFGFWQLMGRWIDNFGAVWVLTRAEDKRQCHIMAEFS